MLHARRQRRVMRREHGHAAVGYAFVGARQDGARHGYSDVERPLRVAETLVFCAAQRREGQS